MTEIADHLEEIDGLSYFWRSAPTSAAWPTLYVHGVPTSSDDWLPFLRLGGGIAPDLPGFGRSAKRADLEYTIAGFDRFMERFVDHLGVERVALVVHDWGGAALAWAQRFPERIARLVIVDAVPLLPGYRWHRTARIWRTRGLGELMMGATTKWGARLLLREATPRPGSMPDDFIDDLWSHFDQGTQRAILALYRSASSSALARAGEHLDAIDAPTLVLWADRDPYLPLRFGEAYAAALPNARLERVDDAGHWPWLDRPELVERIVAFAAGDD